MLIQLIIIQIVTFLIIVVVLRKLLYSETAKEADRLKRLKEEFSLKEKELQVRIEKVKADAEETMARAEETAREYREAKEREAAAAKESLLAKARDHAEDIVRTAINSKEKIKEQLNQELRGKIPLAALRLFKETMPSAALENVHDELVKDVMEKARKMEKEMFKSQPGKGEILTPYPIKKSEKDKLVSIIHEKCGRAVSLAEKEDKNLIAGIVIKLDALIIDGSLENNLRQAAEKLE